MWSTTNTVKKEKMIFDNSGYVDIIKLKELIGNEYIILENLTKEERHKVYSIMSYSSGLRFTKEQSKSGKVNIKVWKEESEETDSDNGSEDEIEEESENEIEDGTDDGSEDKNVDDKLIERFDKFLEHNEKTYNNIIKITFFHATFTMVMFYMLIVTDPVRLIIDNKY